MENGGLQPDRKEFLLHLCCAPCSPHPVNLLKKDYEVTLFFYNPNIHPESEYADRLKEVEKLAETTGLPLITGEYEPDKWLSEMNGLENEPEKGARCELCISGRLKRTAGEAAKRRIKNFGTVLSVSPRKDAVMINAAGGSAQESVPASGGPVRFYKADFKKKDGFKLSVEASRRMGFKRQDYCGCPFSRRNRDGAGSKTAQTAHV